MRIAFLAGLAATALAAGFRSTSTTVSSLGLCDPNNRTDCGYPGINQGLCEGKGCCWNPSPNPNPNSVPWCFFQGAPSPSCNTNPPCSGHGSCTNGACVCTGGFATCGPVSSSDCSVNTNTDTNNCGGCGNTCPTGNGIASSTCSSGSCQITCDSGYIECFGSCYQASNCSAVAPFSPSDMAVMAGYFMANINIDGKGGVVASPSTDSPNYYYHWQRDGAISIREMMSIYSIEQVDTQLKAYVGWVKSEQFQSDPNGIDVRGEPKFFLPDGAVYNGGWMRPQNDGSALRACTLIQYANSLIAAGQKDFVSANLWNNDPSQPGINHDLDYVLSNWNLDSGDPWEEVRGQVFFEKFAARRACILGAALANTFGNSARATTLTSAASAIQANIQSMHWDSNEGIIMEVPQTRPLDSAVHLGVLYGHMGDGFLDPASQEVQSSVAVLICSFKGYSDFSINAADDSAGIPGILVGRYLNDVYNGGNSSQPGGGNPWILCTASLAEIFYRAAQLHAERRSVEITALNAPFFTHALEMSEFGRGNVGYDHGLSTDALAASIVPGTVVTVDSDPKLFASYMDMLTLSGDGIMLRLRHHIEPMSLHCPEELNKDSGVSQGARDLTWSYGTMFGAIVGREDAMAAIRGALAA